MFTLSGHGLMDLQGYDKYLNGELHNYEFPAEDIAKAEAELAKFPKTAMNRSGKW